MPLMPKRRKYRKEMKGRIRGNACRGNTVVFGEFGLMALEPERITARQIEAGRIAVSHYLRRQGKLFRRIFPHTPVSGKPLEVRMGKGKGEIDYYAAKVKPGMILFEIAGVTEEVARQALARVAHKMPIKTRFVTRAQTSHAVEPTAAAA
jgi:large subunit ribosomal protein L16